MSDIQDLERRISAALERIGQALDSLPAQGEDAAADLQAEREATAQLAERLRALKEREATQTAALQEQVDRLTRQLDAQGLEVQRMRKNVISLRESLRALREAQSPDPQLLNKAMQSELDALRATRQTEMFELDEILAELKPLIAPPTSEVQHA
jgi:hypothetical protein